MMQVASAWLRRGMWGEKILRGGVDLGRGLSSQLFYTSCPQPASCIIKMSVCPEVWERSQISAFR